MLFLSSHLLLSPQAEHELRVTQTEFDRQAEVTRLLLEGISSTHVRLQHTPHYTSLGFYLVYFALFGMQYI